MKGYRLMSKSGVRWMGEVSFPVLRAIRRDARAEEADRVLREGYRLGVDDLMVAADRAERGFWCSSVGKAIARAAQRRFPPRYDQDDVWRWRPG